METKSLPSIPPISYPFPWKENPHLAEVEKLACQWIDQYDFLPKDVREKFKKSQLVLFSAVYCPNVNLKIFIPVSRWAVWAFIQDDYYGPQPADQIRAANDRFMKILQGAAPTAEDNELFHQFALIRDESLACGATPEWMERFIKNHEIYFNAIMMERAYNYNDPVRYPTIKEYENIRRGSIGIYVPTGFVELAINFILPTEIATSYWGQRLRDLTSDIVALCNDLYSLKKELYRNEAMNMVLVIQNERGCSLQEAYDETIRMHEEKLEEFMNLTASPPDFGSSDLNEGIKRYISNVKLTIHGNLICSQRAKRYHDESTFFRNDDAQILQKSSL